MVIKKSLFDVIKRVSNTIYLYATKVHDYEIVDYIKENILSGEDGGAFDYSGSEFIDWLVNEELLTGSGDIETVLYEADYSLSSMTICDVLMFFSEANEMDAVGVDYPALITELYGVRNLNDDGELVYAEGEKVLDDDDFAVTLLFVAYAFSRPEMLKTLESICAGILSVKDRILSSDEYVEAKNYVTAVEDLFNKLPETVTLLSKSYHVGS